MKKVITIEAVKGKELNFHTFHKIEDAERNYNALKKQGWQVRYLQK